MGLLRKSREGSRIEIPMSAMIDVVFLLLIYFLLTYREEIPEAHLQVNLPAPDAEPQEEREPVPPIELEVRPREFLFRGRPMQTETIRRALATLAQDVGPEDITVVVKTHVRAPTRNLIEILDICRSVEITNLNVMTME